MLSLCGWQPSSGARIGHLATEPMPSASLIKVPIALAVLRTIDQNRLSLGDEVSDQSVAPVGGAGVLQHLGRCHWPVRDLLTLMVTVSDNLATNLLLDLLDRTVGSGYAAVSEVCRLAGLPDTVLQRPMMDPAAVSASRDNWTTAADQCRLMGLIAGPEAERVVESDSVMLLREMLLAQQLDSGLADAVAPGLRLGHKTGSLPGILHDAGFLLPPGGTPVAIAVLTRGGRAETARAAMTDAARNALTALGAGLDG